MVSYSEIVGYSEMVNYPEMVNYSGFVRGTAWNHYEEAMIKPVCQN